jgi:hypothetical protein
MPFLVSSPRRTRLHYFGGEKEPMIDMAEGAEQWSGKDICQDAEPVLDGCEDVTHVVGSIMVKQA